LLNIEEAFNNQALGEFLASVNSAGCILQTSKCDHWSSSEISEEEEIYGEPWKFGSYVDLIFSEGSERFSLPSHQEFAAALCTLLKRAPEVSCAADFILRRCYFHQGSPEESSAGFGITFYLYGYGADEQQARSRWDIGMKLVENALLQLSAVLRRTQPGS
jgi:hypothetical protein